MGSKRVYSSTNQVVSSFHCAKEWNENEQLGRLPANSEGFSECLRMFFCTDRWNDTEHYS